MAEYAARTTGSANVAVSAYPPKAGAQRSKDEEKDAGRWHRELTLAEKAMRQFWTQGRRVIQRYRNRSGDEDSSPSATDRRYNVFWANVGVLKASLYANPPKPLVKREFDDFQDDAARVAGVMMERLLKQGFETPESDMNVAFMLTVQDRLIPGLGAVWLRYVPTIVRTEMAHGPAPTPPQPMPPAPPPPGPPPGPMGGPAPMGGPPAAPMGAPALPMASGSQKPIVVETITNETVATDYIYWEDFWWSPARVWNEVRWVAKRIYKDKPEFKERFPRVPTDQVTWTKKTPTKYGEKVTPEDLGVEKTEIFEIWSKTDKRVYWISRSYADHFLDYEDDPLELEGFFPCPPPLWATNTTSSLLPTADYIMVQTQYRRVDTLAIRVGMLEDAIQASGFYDRTNKEISQILPGDGTNKMIAVDNWAAFGEKGGIKGAVDWFPVEMITNALDKLRELFQEAKAELYELTGISDIMRGVTAPRETATAQGLKAQYSSVRLQYLQGEVAYFAQNAMRIKAEIISKHFQPETIIRNSLIEYTPDGDIAPEAVRVLKDEWASAYRIQVFADQLAIPDYNAERTARTEFITAMGQFISQVWPMVQQEPGSGPFMLQILQWGIASFRSAASIEGVFDKASMALLQKLQQPPPPPPPDPAVIKAEAEVKKKQAEVQLSQQEAQMQAQMEQQRMQMEQQSNQMDAANEQKKVNADIAAMWAKTRASIATTAAKTSADIRATKAKNQAQIAAQRRARPSTTH